MFSEELFQRLNFSALKWAENTNTATGSKPNFDMQKVCHIVTPIYFLSACIACFVVVLWAHQLPF